jgi:hypothetical protein
MKKNSRVMVLQNTSYIVLSEQLREELELKIDSLYAQNRFPHYSIINLTRFNDETENDLLCAYILGKWRDNYIPTGKLLQGIKIWFNMYYDDRLSVISKFRTCYCSVIPYNKIITACSVNIIFCKFLISELLEILTETKWQPINITGLTDPLN